MFEPTLPHCLALVLAGVLSGGVNAIAGGGSLISFPTLTALGVPPIVANATNALAQVPGSFSSALGFREHVPHIREHLGPLSWPTWIGGGLGGLLLLNTSEKAFNTIVPILILVATLLLMFQPQIKAWTAGRRKGNALLHGVGGELSSSPYHVGGGVERSETEGVEPQRGDLTVATGESPRTVGHDPSDREPVADNVNPLRPFGTPPPPASRQLEEDHANLSPSPREGEVRERSERGGGLNSSPCVQGEVASERSEDDGGGVRPTTGAVPPSPSLCSGTPPCKQGEELSHRGWAVGYALQFIISVYGGYFGAGMGILMLAYLGLMIDADIHKLNALKSWLAVIINLVAGIVFAVQGVVAWVPLLLVMTGSIIGGGVFSRMSQKVPSNSLRWIVVALGWVMFVAFARKAWLG